MGLIMQTPAGITPAIELDDFGAPDIFAHGWAMEYGAEVITGISYIERIVGGVIRRQIACRVHYPRSRWMTALDTTLCGMRGSH